MIITTTHSIDGYNVNNYITTVTGTETYFAGGVMGVGCHDEKLFGQAYDLALSKLEQKAKSLGADAVIGLSLNFATVIKSGAIILTLIGTAVKIEKIYQNEELPCF